MQQSRSSNDTRADSATQKWDERHTNAVAGVVFALIGAYVIWEAQRFGEHGAVTPVFIGVGLIVLSAALVISSFVFPRLVPATQVPTGALKKRGVLVLLMIVWVAVLPIVGFLASSIVAFGLIASAVPIRHQWTMRGVVLHAVGAVSITFAFWYVLTTYLNVPLPKASLF